jgi:hypothetical protein
MPYVPFMSRFLAFLAVLALVLAPASAMARHALHATQASAVSTPAPSSGTMRPMSSCAEHASKQKSDCDARCEMACASVLAVYTALHGAGLSAPAEHSPAHMIMGAPVSTRTVATALLDRPPKFTA